MNFQDLIKKLNIDDFFTKGLKRPKKYTRVKDVVYPKEDYNFMADLLQLPQTDKGYNYLLVVVDLWSDEFDIEPVKTSKSKEILTAFKKIIKRSHLNLPYASITTDGGPEFKKDFQQFLYKNNIYKKTTKKGRKTQNANVESLNRLLGRLINGWMNTQEKKTNKKFVNWDNKKMLNIIRTEFNKIRKKPDGELKLGEYKDTIPKFKVDDEVFYYLDNPVNVLGENQRGTFREGDVRWSLKPVKIKQILRYPGNIPYRYLLNGVKNASYTEQQLKLK
jgi:transposase InsO family protein